MKLKLSLFLLTFQVFCAISHGQTTPASPSSTPPIPFHNFTSMPQAIAGLEKYIQSFNATLNFPGLVFGLSHKRRSILKAAYGTADLSNQTPTNVQNKFRIGSISKSFASAILGQLVDQGKVKYEDLVYKYLDPGHFPVKSWAHKPVNITLHHLLTHTAGIPETEAMAEFFHELDPPANVTQQILRFKNQQLKRAPGTSFEYANNGYQILGAVIEAVTKKSYQEVVAEFLAKNKLSESILADGSQVITNIPRYYSGYPLSHPPETILGRRSKANYPACPYDDMVFLNGWWPAGGLVSTLDDLFHYGQLLINAWKGRPGAILSQKTLKQMWTGQSVPQFGEIATYVKAKYGYGWFISEAGKNDQLRHRNIIFHAGGLPGVGAHLTIYPDEEVIGVVFVNKGTILEKEQMILYAMENMYHLIKGSG